MREHDTIFWIIVRRMRTPLIVLIATMAISILGMVLIPGVDSNGKPYHMNFLDAIYFVTYMASTIGFGEIPYEFTYAQRMWVIFSIFIAVIGWFYAIGALVTLVQDKQLLAEINLARFKRKIKDLKEPFIIILGYNNITKTLINKLNGTKRIVVIDKSQEKIEALELENFIPEVYALSANIDNPEILKLAGIKKRNCKALIVLFNNDFKNTKIALLARLLNERIDLVIKSTTKAQSEHLKNLGIKSIIDPFELIGNRFYLALDAPALWLLEMMFYKHPLKVDTIEVLPRGKYIICGYGRMGQALGKALERANLSFSYIDLKSSQYKQTKQSALFGDKQDYKLLEEAGVKEAVAIVAATKDDLINLTILLTAKKLNPNIYTIARENSIEDITIFQSAKIDRNYILEAITSEYVQLIIHTPLARIFLEEVYRQNEAWGERVVRMLKQRVGDEVEIFELKVSKNKAFALHQFLKNDGKVTLKELSKSLEDRNKEAKIAFLLVKNRKEQVTFLPPQNYEVKVSDTFLIAATKEAKEDFELLVNNINEFHYILTGKDLKFGILKFFSKDENE